MATETVGALSLVPPLLAIGLAILTRRAVLSLFLGIWAGGAIYTGGLGLAQSFDWIIAAMSTEFHATILAFVLLLGAGVAMIWNLGGSYAVRDWAITRLRTQRQAGLATWVLGMLMFFDDYANAAIVGSTMKDVSDQLRISREKLAYIVDSTAAPVSTLAISSWAAFQLGLIEDAYANLGLESAPSAVGIFIRSIPFNMYALLALAMVGIIVLTGRDYGEMLDAEHRSWRTGDVYWDDARPMQDVEGDLGDPTASDARMVNFVVPIVVLVTVTIGSAIYSGYSPDASAWEVITGASYAPALVYGAFAMVGTGFVLGKLYDIAGVSESTDTTIAGFGLMLTAAAILVLAWGLGEAVGALGTDAFVAGFAENTLPPAVLPALVFVLGAFIAFSTGTSWGSMSILTPIVIPVAWQLTGSHTMIAAVVGMIFSGSIFGDHTSPISDTSVLSATFTGADLIDHVRTQLYYASTVAVVAIGLILVWGFARVPPLALVAVGVVLLVGIVYVLSTVDARRKGITPKAADAPQDESVPHRTTFLGSSDDD